AAFLREAPWPTTPPVPVQCSAPILWAAPGAIVAGAGAPPRRRFLLRTATFVERAVVSVRQGERGPCPRRHRRLGADRPVRLPASWIRKVAADAGPVLIGLVS